MEIFRDVLCFLKKLDAVAELDNDHRKKLLKVRKI